MLKCSGCGTFYETETEIRFCRRNMGKHLCGSLMFPCDKADYEKTIAEQNARAVESEPTDESFVEV